MKLLHPRLGIIYLLHLVVALVFALLVVKAAEAETDSAIYGLEETIVFPLRSVINPESFVLDAVCSQDGDGDVTLSCDGVETESPNCFADTGIGYSLVLPSSVKKCKRLRIYIIDQDASAWADTSILLNQVFSSPTGVATAGSNTSITLSAGSSSDNDAYKGQPISIIDGAGAGQTKCICGYDGTTKVATPCTDYMVAPDNTSEYAISLESCETIDSSEVATNVGAIKSKTDQLTFSNTNKLDSHVMSVENNALTAEAMAQSFADKITAFVFRTSTLTIENAAYDGLEALGCRSLLSVVARNTHKNAFPAGHWLTYRADNVTELCNLPVVTDPNAKPIIGIGP